MRRLAIHLSRARRSSGACRAFFEAPGAASTTGEVKLRLAFAASCLPHPEKVKRGGEDSYFGCPTTCAFGVADGVGGWAESGVDPGEFARRLMKIAHDGILDTPKDEAADLQGAFQAAAARLQQEELPGGSTVLLGQLNGTTLAVLNLGDSGLLLLRPALRTPPGLDRPVSFPRVVFRSSDQTHYFNCPYQLCSSGLPPDEPDLIRIRVSPGDLLVAATDGVFDNLFDHQVQAIVARHLGGAWRNLEPVAPQLPSLAVSIAKQAQRIGQQEDNKDIITPFALSAHSEGLSFRGGKLDDTTVVVGLVCRNEEATEMDELLHNWR